MRTQLKQKIFAVGFCRWVSSYMLTGELGKCVRKRQIENTNTKGKLNQRIKHFSRLKGSSRYLGVQKNVTLKLLLFHLAWPPLGKTFIQRIVELLLHLKSTWQALSSSPANKASPQTTAKVSSWRVS